MRQVALVAWGLMIFGCGGTQPAPRTAAATVRAAASEEERHPYAELAPAAGSPTLDGVWVQAASLRKTFDELPLLVQGLPPLAQARELVEGRAGLLPPDVAAVVDVAQPMDAFFSLNLGVDTVAPVWSFRVRSPEGIALGASGLTLRRAAPGVWHVGGVAAELDATAPTDEGRDDDEEEEEDEEGDDAEVLPPFLPTRCQLHHLPPPVDYRLLCSSNPESIAAAAAFLLSPARASRPPTDLHVEVAGASYAGFRERMLEVVRRDDVPATSTSQRSGRQLARDLFEALLAHERLTLDFSLSRLNAQLELELVYGELPSQPALSQWLAQSTQAALPSSYPRLPADSGLKLGLNLGSAFSPFVLSEVEKHLDEDTLTSTADKQELLASLGGILPHDGRFSVGIGLDVPALLDALDNPAVRLADDADKPLGAAAVKQLQAANGGFVVIGMEEPPARFLPAVRRAFRAGQMKTKPRPGHEDNGLRTSSRLATLTGAPRGLPKETLHVVEEVRPERSYVPPADGSKPAILPYDQHYVIVPDGERVWIVASHSEAVAVAQARALLARSGSPESAPEPAVLSAATQVAFFELAQVELDSKSERESARRQLAAVNRAPAQGRLAIPLVMQVLARSDAPGYRLRVRSNGQLDELLAQASGLITDSD